MHESTETTRQIVTRFWTAMRANDWAAAAALFADDYVLTWPQSGERIRGGANFVAVNATYPAAGRWRFAVEQLVVEGGTAVTDVVVTDGAVADLLGQRCLFSATYRRMCVGSQRHPRRLQPLCAQHQAAYRYASCRPPTSGMASTVPVLPGAAT